MSDTQCRFSPSQFKLFRSWDVTGQKEGCVGKWAWSYIDKLREGSDAGKDVGSDTHTHMELYLQFRIVPDDDDKSAAALCAKALIASAPLPDPEQPGLTVEQDFEFKLEPFDDVLIIGKRDYFVGTPTKVRLEDGTIVEDAVVVGDHKTTKSFKYLKSKRVLREDVQVGAYVLAAIQAAISKPRYVVVRWHYVEKEAHLVKTTELVFDTQAESDLTIMHKWVTNFQHDAAQMRSLKVLARELTAEGIPGPFTKALVPLTVLNDGACGAFRGCSHAQRCNKKMTLAEPLTPDEWKAHVEHELMAKETPQEKLARIKAEKAAATGTKAPVTEGKGGAAEKLAAKRAAEAGGESKKEVDESDDEEVQAEKALAAAKAAKAAKAHAAEEAAKAPPAPAKAAAKGGSTDLLKEAAQLSLDEGNYARAAAVSMILSQS